MSSAAGNRKKAQRGPDPSETDAPEFPQYPNDNVCSLNRTIPYRVQFVNYKLQSVEISFKKLTFDNGTICERKLTRKGYRGDHVKREHSIVSFGSCSSYQLYSRQNNHHNVENIQQGYSKLRYSDGGNSCKVFHASRE